MSKEKLNGDARQDGTSAQCRLTAELLRAAEQRRQQWDQLVWFMAGIGQTRAQLEAIVADLHDPEIVASLPARWQQFDSRLIEAAAAEALATFDLADGDWWPPAPPSDDDLEQLSDWVARQLANCQERAARQAARAEAAS